MPNQKNPHTLQELLDALTQDGGIKHNDLLTTAVGKDDVVGGQVDSVAKAVKFRLEVHYDELGPQLGSLDPKNISTFFAEFDSTQFQDKYSPLTDAKVKVAEGSRELARLIGMSPSMRIEAIQHRLDLLIQAAEPALTSSEANVRANAETFVDLIRKIKENLE
ncbi:MAG: hypothetical protein WC897_02245 [Candidatus Gracilibacteria bacterium]